MASEVDICNLALARLGDAATVATIDPPEGSAQAEHCARFYPIARNAMLENHSWRFATRRALLAQLAVDSWNWGFAYARPSGALRVLKVLPATSGGEEDGEPFESLGAEDGTDILLTDLDEASALYTTVVTDAAKFSPLFVDALAWLLASYLAGPVIKGDAGSSAAKGAFQNYLLMAAQAKASDANQRKKPVEHTPEWIGGR